MLLWSFFSPALAPFPISSSYICPHHIHYQLCCVGAMKPQMRSSVVLGSAVMPFSKGVGFPKLTRWARGKEQGDGQESPTSYAIMISPCWLAVLHFCNFSYSLKRKELPLYFGWGRRSVTTWWFLYSYTVSHVSAFGFSWVQDEMDFMDLV